MFTASIIFSDNLYKYVLTVGTSPVLLYLGRRMEAENPKPVCKELVIAKGIQRP